jgi:DNA-binding MarR family transcriptional regulator
MGPQAAAPVEKIPQDLTKGQYTILKIRRQGYGKPKDIAKYLSMDKREVEKEIDVLKGHGYLTKDGKLTSKGLESLS